MLPWSLMLVIIRDLWAVKVAYEVIATPLTYAIVTFLKRVEGIDTFDRGTDFSPIPGSALRSLVRSVAR